MDDGSGAGAGTGAGCRWCGSGGLEVVLDLGRQPASDHFPLLEPDEPSESGASVGAEDPRWPLRMGLCPRCHLAQLLEDPGTSDEPRGLEPQALVDQAHEAVAAVRDAGLLPAGCRVREHDSPHGGSWRGLLVDAGCVDVTDFSGPGSVPADVPADVVVDVFGLMHDADQRAALEERVAGLAPGGTLLLQFHSLHSIVRQEQWNALRHGHMAYYATSVLVDMLAELGLVAHRAWTFELYGGTVLLAAQRPTADVSAGGAQVDDPVLAGLLETDERSGVRTAAGLAGLETAAGATATELASWLAAHRDAGRRVVGYGAASRAVPLLVRAGIDAALLPAVADASPAKQGRRLPACDIPIVPADRLRTGDDDVVLLFVPDLLAEVRRAYPEVVERGAVWAVSEPRPHLA